MKRVTNLFDAIWDRNGLNAAAHRAALGKQDRPEVFEFLNDLDINLNQISVELRDGSFRFEDYRTFMVQDTKRRVIHAPTFRDRVVHHAIILATGDTFEKGALDHSYACRAEMGHHRAVRQTRRRARTGDWYGKMDIQKFYDNVDHEWLRRRLWRRFREKRVLNLFDVLLESYSTQPGKGLPIGALTSQYLGNFYLDHLDHSVKERCSVHRYLRYMDDSLAIGTQAELREVRKVATHVLGEMGLCIKNGGEWNRCELGIPYLGFVVYPNRLRVGKQARQRFRRKYKGLDRKYLSEQIDEEEYRQRTEALFAHVSFADDLNWRKMVCRISRVK